MTKKLNAIMISDTRPSLIGTILIQLTETNAGLFDEAIIYYDKINDKDKELMNNIMPCRFIKFHYEMPKEVKKLPAFEKFSPLMFSRYYMFDLLKEYETVTWIDTDVLICGRLDNIIKKAKIGGMSANFEDPKNKSYKYTDTVKTSFVTPLENYDMTRYNMSSGLITVSDNLPNYEKMTKWCFDKTIELADNLVLPDQGILNILIQEFNINTECVGENGAYCFYPTYKRDASKAKIIHSWGARKFWKSWYLYNEYPKWNEYYQKWLNMGGSDQIGEILPDISIVIPMFNPKTEYFKYVLEDLLVKQEQDHGFQYDNFELILVVDGELNKDFMNLLKEYNDPRVKLIHNKERAGIAKSINIGIKNAKAKYIARIDDDDRINCHRLFEQKKYLDSHPQIDLVTSNFEYFGDLNEERISFEGEMAHAWSIFTCPFDHPTIMFRKDFFEKNNLYYDETRSHVEDWELWLRAFKKGMKVGSVPQVLYYHRWYNGQAGQNKKTIEMMRELVYKNFKQLDINIKKEDLSIISPWNGRISENEYKKLEKVFTDALKNNKIKKIYNQEALEKVFNYRLFEAKNGYIPDIVIKKETSKVTPNNNSKQHTNNSYFRRILRRIYRPIKKRIYLVSAEAACDNANYLYGRIKDLNNNNFNNQKEQIFKEISRIENSNKSINKKIDNKIAILEEKDNKITDKIEDINNIIIELNTQINKLSQDVTSQINLLQMNADGLKEIAQKQTNHQDNFYDFKQEIKFYKEQVFSNLFFTKKVILFGTSEHGNIGDAAITIGTYEFFRKYYTDYKIIDISTYEFNDIFPKVSGIINDDDIIFLQGGGNLGNKYLVEENIRRKVIESFPNNKIIILPQTIYFDDNSVGKEELEKSQEIYNKHENLTLFTRGAISLDLAKRYFPKAKSYKSLDMALNIRNIYNYQRKGILTCIRDLNDESGITKEQYEMIFKIVKNYDNEYEQNTNVINDNIYKPLRSAKVNEQLMNFAKHKLVITDRLHGLIFSLMTDTPCIVLSSYNYKLNEFVEMLKDNKNIKFIDKNINNLDSTINYLLNNETKFDKDYRKEFEELYDNINK